MTSRFLGIIFVLSSIGFDATAEKNMLRTGSQQKLTKKKTKTTQATGTINLTTKEKDIVKRAQKTFKDSEGMKPPSKEFSDRMQDQVNE